MSNENHVGNGSYVIHIIIAVIVLGFASAHPKGMPDYFTPANTIQPGDIHCNVVDHDPGPMPPEMERMIRKLCPNYQNNTQT
jgi:hypothetical protein